MFTAGGALAIAGEKIVWLGALFVWLGGAGLLPAAFRCRDWLRSQRAEA